MAKKKDDQSYIVEEYWLTKVPWLSSAIFLCTYGVFGWKLGQTAESWLIYWREKGASFGLLLEDDLLLTLIRITTLIIIILISISLTTPVALVTFVFEKSLRSDFKAFIYILLWSILVVFALCYFNFFANLLVIISANILLRLDLQNLKLKMWQIIILIIFMATLSFYSGLLLFEYLHNNI